MTRGWPLVKLDEVALINPPKPRYTELADTDIVGFIPMAAVDEVSGTVAMLEQRPLAELRAKSYRTFASNDVIFAKITPCMENGKSAVVPALPNDHGFGSTEFHVIRPDSRADARYIWRFVRQRSFRSEAARHMTGSVGQLRVPVDFLRATEIPLPSIDEQREIITLLDNFDHGHDFIRGHLDRARQTLATFRQSVLASACSGRLTEDWRQDHPEVVSVEGAIGELAGTTRRKRKSAPPTDLELPDLPDSYIASTIAEAAVVLEYGTSKRSESDPSGVAVLRMGNIQSGGLCLDDLKYCPSDAEIERLLLRDGDILFNRTNSPELVGKTAVYHESTPMAFASYLIRVRVAPEVADPDFVSYWINSAWGRLWARQAKTDGVSQSNINGTKLAGMPLPLPPIEEQHEIVRRVHARLDSASQIQAQIERATKLLDRTGQAALAKAFRGELLS